MDAGHDASGAEESGAEESGTSEQKSRGEQLMKIKICMCSKKKTKSRLISFVGAAVGAWLDAAEIGTRDGGAAGSGQAAADGAGLDVVGGAEIAMRDGAAAGFGARCARSGGAGAVGGRGAGAGEAEGVDRDSRWGHGAQHCWDVQPVRGSIAARAGDCGRQ